MGTTIAPTLTRDDRIAGEVFGEFGEIPDAFVKLEVYLFIE